MESLNLLERSTMEVQEVTRGGDAAAWWAIGGVALLFANAALRLGERGIDAIAGGLSFTQWLVLAALTVVFVYGEGVLALQMKYIPRLLERVQTLRGDARVLPRLLAPLHAMMLVYAPAVTLLRAWAGIAAIALAVVIIRSFPDPWRGIVDFAVAAALLWATIVLLVRGYALLTSRA